MDLFGTHTVRKSKRNHYSQFRFQPDADAKDVSKVHSPTKEEKKRMVLSEESDFTYDPCAQRYLVDFLNDPSVQAALHVSTTPSPQPSVSTLDTSTSSTNHPSAQDNLRQDAVPNTRRWDFCSDEVNEHWAENDLFADTTELYKLIYTHKHKPKDFKMLVFSGDIDGVCATIGTQHWIYNVTDSAPLTLYQPWTYTDTVYGQQLGGYLTTFADSFTFLTIRYAGHEVPAYQPQKALHMLRMFLDGSMFDKTSSSRSSGKGASTSGNSEDISAGGNIDSNSVDSTNGGGGMLSLVMSVLLLAVVLLGLTACFRKQLFARSASY